LRHTSGPSAKERPGAQPQTDDQAGKVGEQQSHLFMIRKPS